MQRITADSKVENVLQQLGVGEGEELRESQMRKNRLEKFAQLLSKKPETSLELVETNENDPNAWVEAEEGQDTDVEDIEDGYREISVTCSEIEQNITDLPDNYYDYISQKAFTIHEVGHILYSDYYWFRKYLREAKNRNTSLDTDSVQQLFHQVYNICEDGAIEHFLSTEYRVGEELSLMRMNMHEGQYNGVEREDKDGVFYFYPSIHMVSAALFSVGIYDNGELDKLLDENNSKFRYPNKTDFNEFKDTVLPAIEHFIPKIQSAGSAKQRMEHIFDLWIEIEDFLDNSMTPGAYELETQGDGGKGGNMEIEEMEAGYGEQAEEPNGEAIEVDIDIESGSTPGQENKEEAEEIQEEIQEGGKSEIEEEIEKEMEREAREESGDWSEEIENIIDTLQGGEGMNELIVAEKEKTRQDINNRIKKTGKRAEKHFRRNLRRLQEDSVIKKQKRGKFDARRMISAERGSPKVFEQTDPGEDKDYSCVVVADRSGSMSSDVDEMEEAVGTITTGLEAVGVDTCVLDVCSSKTRLAKPFGTKTKQFSNRLFTGRTSGGTPITHTIKFARERINQGAGDEPFIIVVSDGGPASRERYLNELKKCSFPVLGVYLNNGITTERYRNKRGIEKDLEIFHRGVVCGKDGDVQQKLIDLINGVMF